MLRAPLSVTGAKGAMRRTTYTVPVASLCGVRPYHTAHRSHSLAVTFSGGLSNSFESSALCFPATLAETKRRYAEKPNPHDSNTEDSSNTFFDVQDVNADRLTHFYWDSNDEADTPYDASLWDSLLGEGELDEWSGESLTFVDERDHQLLEKEYLQ
ncbi:hypothetical protein ABB37_02735 [Leptomonas pyrrhocoris]|uniref:Uncharacterized protein n=1 Tax=Leptomonas pyrrhocoris TaxID=157538 RepID=A0A0N0DXN1_LEPPY|nr:hypothetical protein ABB37_02735 [Leptomonas pyrrhocoris]KPA83002.1 hypothetical protein ABB37_02735 [Leptomonas pyrrhocoris]|eukprot:XP_015661441.1 hypothetical protein ABB37_02735 [Leptomonas pyrrhocoris]